MFLPAAVAIEERLEVEVLVPGADFEARSCGRVSLDEECSIPQDAMHEVAGRAIQDDEIDPGRPRSQIGGDPVRQVRGQPRERPRWRLVEEDRDVDVARRTGLSTRPASEEPGRDDIGPIPLEKAAKRGLEFVASHAVIIA